MFERTKLNLATTKMAGEVYRLFGPNIADQVRKIVDDGDGDGVIMMKQSRWSGMEAVEAILGSNLSGRALDDPLYSAIECGFVYALNQAYSAEDIPAIYETWTEKKWPY